MRQATTAVAAGVLVVALAGCGWPSPSEGGWEDPLPYAGIAELPESLGPDGTTIAVGDPMATSTVRVFEDPRCPVVEEFERSGGATSLRQLLLDRRVKAEYTFASSRDRGMGGKGSARAVNALRAALEVGKFTEYHDVLFGEPPESPEPPEPPERAEGGPGKEYTTEQLLALADRVPGLRGDEFDHSVRQMKFRHFVVASQKAYERFERPRGPGTPTVVVNGRTVPDGESDEVLFDRIPFEKLLTQAQGTDREPDVYGPAGPGDGSATL
ncbi:DsbA family protein [Streptomyces yaizuensis]|uniref:Thioredoxin domain-containing protein n=1 Tax=Streptomyces yaizuensis TaxID=2989713 RepID=A0ABQ5P954_9ACTN|nr:thioredoxin domain-containing protein [Streptomyces sp. YSPA8]GLF99092.1 thioredoxin domain-containing protein [Streptomyces sp. YSPA8]